MARDESWLTEVQVCPSILAADFGAFRAQVVELMDAGARTFHVDVMDGHFVPVITFGHEVVEAIADEVHSRGGALAVHMMVQEPERLAADYAKAGADSFTIHIEATRDIHRALQIVEELGMVPGVTLNPATPVAAIVEAARYARNLLCMSVSPGWGGQAFIGATLERLPQIRALAGAGVGVEVDGGIGPDTIAGVYAAGANRLTAGSAIYRQPDPGQAYVDLVERVRAAGATIA
ncbi:MAG: ribulose-phosphate 3-epimerase [Actinomycetota bacterium]